MRIGQELHQRLKLHDPSVAEELYRTFFGPARKAAFEILRDSAMAEDVAQETMYRAWMSAGSYDESRGSFLTWIVAIAQHLAFDYARSPMMRTAPAGSVKAEDQKLGLEELTSVLIALERVHPIEKLVLTLMFYEGLSHAEIARRLNRPLGTIKTWVRTALTHIREQIIPVPDDAIDRSQPSQSERFAKLNLKRSETLLRYAIEQDTNAIALSDKTGAFILYNKSADRLLGIQKAEADPARDCTQRYGLYRPDGITPYPVYELPLWRAIRGEYIFNQTIYVRNPGAPLGFPLSVSARPKLDELGHVAGGILHCRRKPGRSEVVL